MQNVQNAEIQQRVINLVELYRTKVGKESQIAKDAKADDEFWHQESVNMMVEEGLSFSGELYGEGPHTEIWIKHLKVNEQLLGHFYSVVAGENAEKEILDQFLPDVYDKTIFTEEEEAFLASHFKEMVNFIILTPCDDSLEWVHRHDSKNAYTIPSEVLELVKSRVEIPTGSKVYYPNTVFAQLANLFDGCSYYCDTMFYAWTKVAVYANNIDAVTLDKGGIPSCDAIVSYLAQVSDKSNTLIKIKEAYKNMSTGGKLILLCPNELLWKKNTDKDNCPQEELRKQLVLENSIIEIIQLPSVMSPNLDTRNWCLLIAEKGHGGKYATLIDARFAFKETKYSLTMDDMIGMGEDLANRQFTSTETGRMVMTSGPFGTALDTNALKAMIDNNGILAKEGLRKVVHVDKSQLDADNLLPQIYVIERPVPEVETIPLDSICQLMSRKVKSLDFDLPSDTPWIKEHNLSNLFHGALDIETLEKADCPNNPPHDSDYEFDKDGLFIEDSFHYMLGYGNSKSMRVAQFRACTYLDGKSDAVIYCQDKNGVKTALLISTGKPVVVEGEFVSAKKYNVFCPSRGVDILMLLAIMRMPVVYRQIQAYEEFGLNNHLKDILVPWNKLFICDEKKRLLKEEIAFKAQNEKYNEMKTDYINEVRMRKHDMRPHMKQLNSAKNLMQHYVDNLNATENVQEHLNRQLIRFRDALSHLSDIIEHLSDEEKFGEPERFSIIDYFEKLITESINNNCDIAFNIDSDAVESYLKKKLYEYRDHIIASTNAKDQEYEKGEYTFPTHWSYAIIAPLDFDRIVQNIIENARMHGFTDQTRTDYMIWINLSVDEERDLYIIDFMNNGTPLPNGMTKTRYGLKGEKAGLTGGTGSGGYIVKSIITHYGGDYDVFCKDGITTIRIYLPIATI